MTHVTPNLGAVGLAPPGQQGSMGAGAVTRRHSHSAHVGPSGLGVRQLTILVLGLITVIAVGYLLLRSGGGAGGSPFATAHDNLVAAAAQAPVAASGVHRDRELGKFDKTVTGLVNRMQDDLATFRRIAHESNGQSRAIAQHAVAAATNAVEATDEFRRAIAFSKKLDLAQSALSRLDTAIAELNSANRDWEKA